MNTERFVRRKDSNLIVTFDRPYYARVTIPITAYIRTDVVLSPGSATFGAVEQGKSAKRDIAISYAGRADWKIKSSWPKQRPLLRKGDITNAEYQQ